MVYALVGMADTNTEEQGEGPVAPRRQGRTGSAGGEERSRGEERQGGEDARDGFGDTWVRENDDRSRQRAARVSQVEASGRTVRDYLPYCTWIKLIINFSVWSWAKIWCSN